MTTERRTFADLVATIADGMADEIIARFGGGDRSRQPNPELKARHVLRFELIKAITSHVERSAVDSYKWQTSQPDTEEAATTSVQKH